MKPTAQLRSEHPVPFSMRTIGPGDIERLRTWKNSHRQFFFYKELITAEQQEAWYRRWAQETHDHMFMIKRDAESVGCIGIRLFQGTADIYNVILGDKKFGGQGIMSEALCATVAFSQLLYPALPICVRVLQTNPAIDWYERNGFARAASNEEFVTMKWARLTLGRFQCQVSLLLPHTIGE